MAYYDSYAGSGDGFDGCWGTYPFLPSGNIISSDINSSSNGMGRLLIYERQFQQACYINGVVTDATTSNPIGSANVEILNGLSSGDVVYVLPSKSLFDYQQRFRERVNASFSFG